MLTDDARVPLHALPSTHAHISAAPALLSVALIESPPRYSLPPPDQRAALGGHLSPQIALEQLRSIPGPKNNAKLLVSEETTLLS